MDLTLATGVFDFGLSTDTSAHTDATLAGFAASEERAYGNEGLVFQRPKYTVARRSLESFVG
jgi:hypothetical protein